MRQKATVDLEKSGFIPDAALALIHMRNLLIELNPPVPRRGPKRERVRLGPSDKQKQLRGLVEDWRMAGRNLHVLFERAPQLRDWIDSGQTKLYITPGGRAHLDWQPQPSSNAPHGYVDGVLEAFTHLISNPACDLLADPCPRCGDYFLKIHRRRKYCSNDCGHRTTAEESVKKTRQRIQERKIARVNAAIRKWSKEKSRNDDWKNGIVSSRLCTRNWITIHLKKGDLIPPVVASKRKPAKPINL